MSDIVERLLVQDSDWIYTERAEAAAEITRLRAELAEARAKAFEEAAEWLTSSGDDSPQLDRDAAIAGRQFGLLMDCAQAIRAMIDKG